MFPRPHLRDASSPQAGVSLLELIVTIAILLVLASAAFPILRNNVVREKESELHRSLREIRDAIDRYKDLSDKNLIRSAVGSEGYPPDLETLVKGVTLGSAATQRVRFLRRIPVDPMTGRSDWVLRSVKQNSDSSGWDGRDVFDVHSQSRSKALDGTSYSDW